MADTLALLRTEIDGWVASADEMGRAYLVPLSHYWDGAGSSSRRPVRRKAKRLLSAENHRISNAAEREGFEPSDEVAPVTRFPVAPVQPLRHLSEGRSA